MTIRTFLTTILLVFNLSLFAQNRPFIWVQQNDKEIILQKIKDQAWADSIYHSFKARLDQEIVAYEKNPDKFIEELPYDCENQNAGTIPPFIKINRNQEDGKKGLNQLAHYLQIGIDCGIVWFLTDEEKYAQCATDILYSIISGIEQVYYPTKSGNNGWLQPSDHLYEARAIGAQIPIIYDFISSYIKEGGQAYDFIKKHKVEFPVQNAQQVFKKYAELAINQGMTGSNWSVLEAPSLVQNILALDNKIERDSLLNIYLTIGSERQDPLSTIAKQFQKTGDVYPETSQYSSGVATLSTVLIAILSEYQPSLNLAEKYRYIPLALSRWDILKYPNGEIARFGDGKRHGGTSFTSCEYAYYLGNLVNNKEITETFGNLLNTAIHEGNYSRAKISGRDLGANVYFAPLKLLWGVPEIKGDIKNETMPRTEEMPHAALFLQRNLSNSKKSENDLMCFVGGSHMVHGHAEGMNIELYGCGQVLGVDNGRGSYSKDIHENYSRLFAAHNTVIVNGNSCSEGGWVNLGINSIKLSNMEPMPRETAISPYYSFSTTNFIDDKGDKAEAFQERTLALIRTSENTGYYVDVFRSKSKLPNEYHDYLYHNIGDKLNFLNKDLKLFETPNRYKENANLPWVQNRQYRHPGWHFFENVQSSTTYNQDVRVQFLAEQFDIPIYMNLYIPRDENREYSKVKAPPTYESPTQYEKKTTPTLVIRKKGEAWTSPFVVIYEPFTKIKNNNSIQSVEKLNIDGEYRGVKVTSIINERKLIQYIITQQKNQQYINTELGISFYGTFAIITTNENGEALNIYMGEGNKLTFKNISITSDLGSANAYLDLNTTIPKLQSSYTNEVNFTIE